MKKNKIMRFASAIMVMTLLSTCMVGGTFAKYVTTAEGSDSARVATWGFTADDSKIVFEDLFVNSYNSDGIVGADEEDVIAPGASGNASFTFNYDGQELAPEVKYEFAVNVDESVIADDIKANDNIQWKLDDGTWGNWDALMGSIKNLSGDASGVKEYSPGQLPAAFQAADTSHTIYWQWIFETSDDQNVKDTAMGNKSTLDQVKLVITITATQID